MSITIHHFEGRFSDHDRTFPASTNEILFGRSSECDIIYPADCTGVAPRHLKLRQSDDYGLRIEVVGTGPAEVDGRRRSKKDGPVDAQFGCTVRIGGNAGPTFRIGRLTVTIRHDDGPLAGKKQYFDGSFGEITFGRDPQNDVVFPSTCKTVGRRHCLLRRNAFSEYEIEFPEEHYVSVDGRPIPHGLKVQVESGQELRLGDRNGPAFAVVLEPATGRRTLDLATTMLNEPVKTAAGMLYDNRRALLVGLMVVSGLLVALAIGVVLHNRGLDHQLALMEEDQAKLARQTFKPEVITKLKEAVYLLVQRTPDHEEIPIATAWALGPSELATNAHVVKALECIVERTTCTELNAGGTVWLRGPQLKKDIQVIGWRAHDGYDAFHKELSIFRRNFPALGEWSLPSAYDVGILKVDGTLPPPYLTIAPLEKLRNLAAGTVVAYAGFPLRDMEGQPMMTKAPDPKVQCGYITSLTDVFVSHADDPSEQLLVQHSIPGTGGSSGSPIVTTDGEVIAIFSGGNVTKIDGRLVPNAAMVNFGQRADVLDDLLEGKAAKAVARDKVFWQERAAELDNFRKLAIDSFESEAKRLTEADMKPEVVAVKDAELGAGLATLGAKRVSSRHEVALEPQWLYGFLVITEGRQPVGLYLEEDGKRVGLASEGKYFGRYVDPTEWLAVKSSTKIEPVVWALAKKPLRYELLVYRWKMPSVEGPATTSSAAIAPSAAEQMH